MAKIDNVKAALEISKNLSDKHEIQDVVCIASHVIAICMVSYGFKGKILDGALEAINEDIKEDIKAFGSFIRLMKECEK